MPQGLKLTIFRARDAASTPHQVAARKHKQLGSYSLLWSRLTLAKLLSVFC